MFPQNDPRQMGRYRRGQLSQPVQPMNPNMNTPNQPQMGTGQPDQTQLSQVRMNPPNAFSYGGVPGQVGTGRDQPPAQSSASVPVAGGTLPPAARAQTSRMQPPGMPQSQSRQAQIQMQNQQKPRF